jgi:protocatechuate 3,4-dioxygenase beta subunit
MIRETVIGALALASLAFPALANSGLGLGESVTPFHPTHITGPDKGTDTCPPCKYGAIPAVQVWVNGDSMENVSKIAGVLNKNAVGNSKFKGFVIFVSKSKDTTAKLIQNVATKTGFNAIGMAVIDPGNEAIENYKINLDSEIKNTVFVYKNKKVMAKFVNLEASDKGLSELGDAIAGVTK